MELYICGWIGVKQFFREWERTTAREVLGGGQCYVRGIMLWDGMKEQERFSVGLRIEKSYR